MAKFNFSNERFSIVDLHNRRVDLSPQEAVELLKWLSDRRLMLLRLSRQSIEPEEQIEIHFQPQDLVHLDQLQAVIPQMQERIPATNIFVSPVSSVTERAIELLKEFEIEYKIHPLLEDSNEFAQG